MHMFLVGIKKKNLRYGYSCIKHNFYYFYNLFILISISVIISRELYVEHPELLFRFKVCSDSSLQNTVKFDLFHSQFFKPFYAIKQTMRLWESVKLNWIVMVVMYNNVYKQGLL